MLAFSNQVVHVQGKKNVYKRAHRRLKTLNIHNTSSTSHTQKRRHALTYDATYTYSGKYIKAGDLLIKASRCLSYSENIYYLN